MALDNGSNTTLVVEVIDNSACLNHETSTEKSGESDFDSRTGSLNLQTTQGTSISRQASRKNFTTFDHVGTQQNESLFRKRRRNEASFVTGFKQYYFLATHCSEEENESSCYECECGGELICCDTCVRAFHLPCLLAKYRPLEPREASAPAQWSCPICLYFRLHEDLEKRRGILLKLRHPIAVPPPECNLKCRRFKQNKRGLVKSCSPEQQNSTEASQQNDLMGCRQPHCLTRSDTFREAHHHYLYEDANKREMASSKSQLTEVGVSRFTRRNAPAATQDKKNETNAGAEMCSTLSLARMSIGPEYQVPHFPIPFLEIQSLGRSYTRRNNLLNTPEGPRMIYSSTAWTNKARSLGITTPFLSVPLKDDTNKNDIMKQLLLLRVRGLTEDVYQNLQRLHAFNKEMDSEFFVDTQEKLINFCHTLSARWPPANHWPYSSEYAYKILFSSQFDAKTALEKFQDTSSFNFQAVCDPPLRPYFNKWKPKDKRSLFPATPFPPPQHLHALYTAANPRTRFQAAYGSR